MFDIVFTTTAESYLRRVKRFYARQILVAIDRHLRHEPERPSKASIKRLRGRQRATFRLRAGEYRVFYDVGENTVTVVAILHKSETAQFYEKEQA